MSRLHTVSADRTPSTTSNKPNTMRPRVTLALLLLSLAIPFTGVEAQLKLQSPPNEIHHPRGDLFVQNLDAVWTAAGEVLEGASILIRDGVIQAIGTDLAAPAGVTVLDGRGRTAIPGIVDEHSHIAMVGTNEGTQPIVPEVLVLDALDPASFGIYQALSGGVTTARIMHGSSNPIGGQSAVIKTRWGMDEARQLLVPGAPRSVKFALGENVTRKRMQGMPGGGPPRFPATRQGVEAIYDQAFTAAREYRRVWAEYERNPQAFRTPPRRDLRLEALVDIMENRILVHAHSYRSDEILMLMRVAERYGFRIDNFTHILEGYRVAEELREHGAGASTFSDWWQFKLEAYDAIPYNAAIMADQGVLTAINSDIPWLQSFMKWEIAKPVQYGGASKEEAIRMLTINPATIMGVANRVGSLEVGKDGDVVLLTGDPFDAFSRLEMTIVDGIVYFDSNREEDTRGEPFHALPATEAERHVAAAGSVGASGSSAPQPSQARSVDPQEFTPLSPRAESFALVGATIHPVSGPAIADGAIVVMGGRIQAVGPRAQVQVPEGVRRIDASGRHIYPGMIDPITYLGLFEFGQVGQASDRTDTGAYNPHIRALAAFQPHYKSVGVARARGITTVLTAQTGGVIQGMGSVVQLEGDTFERAEVRAEGALLVNFPVPSRPAGAGGGGRGQWGPGSVEFVVDHHGHGRDIIWAGDELFAQEHDEGPVAVQQARRRGGSESEPNLDGPRIRELIEFFKRAREFSGNETVEQRPDAPFEVNIRGMDLVALRAMQPVLRGEVPVFFRVDTEWQLRHLYLFLDEFPELVPVVVGGAQAFKQAEELARREIPVVLTRTRSPTPDRDDSILAAMRNAAILHEAGVTVAFGTDESADVRNLPEHVAIAVSFGLPVEEGLRGVTLNAAAVLGLADEMGSLDPGKRADILVTDGDPLQPLTTIQTMFIGGVEVDPRDNAHHRDYERFRERR
jgi:imidazolonepropionase-like amidohydrolase